MDQLELFPDILKSICLVAPDSPKKAFYRLWLYQHGQKKKGRTFELRKESGITGSRGLMVTDRRAWFFNDQVKAEKAFETKIKHKTDLKYKRKRRYREEYDIAGK